MPPECEGRDSTPNGLAAGADERGRRSLSISFGAEVISGNGALRINNLDMNVDTITSSGMVHTTITGAGSTSVAAAASPAEMLASDSTEFVFSDSAVGSGHTDQSALLEDTSTAGNWFAQDGSLVDASLASSSVGLNGLHANLGAADFLF